MPHLPKSRWLFIACSAFTSWTCTGSDFAGKSSKGSSKPLDDVSASPANAGGTVGTPSMDAAISAAPASDVGAAATGCTAGCCPSQKVAFVDCSNQAGAKAAAVNKGPFDIGAVACDQVSAAGSIKGFDTVVYYGPMNHGQAQGLPAGVESVLNDGGKVIAFPTAEFGLFDHAFYGLTLETNIEILTTVGTGKVTVTNANAMSSAFSTAKYASSTISHLMFPGPFLLVDRSTFTAENQAHWCSDLTIGSPLMIQMSPVHGLLYDNGPRKGLLIASTIQQAGGAGNFDFTEPFLAAHLSQPWNRAGGSQACGLPCTAGADGGTFTRPTGVGKPVIYLYPTKEQDIDVKLDFDGDLITTYPKYNQTRKGWRVRARPDGQMIDADDHHEYSYIYWNGTTKAMKTNFDEGFVVKGEDTRKFLQDTLARLGLSPRESNDMIVYWLPYMERHAYNLISFAHESYTNVAKLSIEPKPDALLRVFMQFKALKEPIVVKAQKLDSFSRHGFTAVEWGGAEIDGEWHVIQ